MRLTSLTIAICEIEAPAHLLAIQVGACQIEATVEGTSAREAFTFQVVDRL